MWLKISLAIVSLIVLTLPQKLAVAQQQSKDKVYVIYLDSASRGNASYTLQNIETVQFQGLDCIKGRFALKENWLEGKHIYIPKNKVQAIAEFNSLDEYKSAVKKHYQKKYE